MKLHNILAIALVGVCAASCMDDDWDAPDMSQPLYGNNDIQQTKVITIADLKTQFLSNITGNTASDVITDDVQIKAVITGNDIGGNIYKQLTVQDATGGIVIGINKTSLYTYLPVGQTVVIDLKGLRVGGYGKQAQVGDLYNGSMGRMDDALWQSHVCLIDEQIEGIEPVEFDPSWDKDMQSAVLVKITGATISGTGTQTLAPDDGSVATSGSNNINRDIYVGGKKVALLRTSTYADFASLPLPVAGETVDLVGIATRFNNDWQILLRSAKDYQIVAPEPTVSID